MTRRDIIGRSALREMCCGKITFADALSRRSAEPPYVLIIAEMAHRADNFKLLERVRTLSHRTFSRKKNLNI